MYRISRLRLYSAILITLLLETNLVYIVSLGNIRPNLMLILVIFVGLFSDWRDALEAGIVGGLLKGAISSGSVGINLTVLSLCGLVVSYSKNKVYKESVLTQVTLTFFIALVFNLINLFVKIMVRNVDYLGIDIKNTFGSIVVFVSLYTSLLAPLAFIAFKKFFSFKKPEF